MVSLEGVGEFATVTAASLVPVGRAFLQGTPAGMMAVGVGSLLGGAVSTGWSRWNGASWGEAFQDGGTTAVSIFAGGAAFKLAAPYVGRLFGPNAKLKDLQKIRSDAIDELKTAQGIRGAALKDHNKAQQAVDNAGKDLLGRSRATPEQLKRLDKTADDLALAEKDVIRASTAHTAARRNFKNAPKGSLANLSSGTVGANGRNVTTGLGVAGGAGVGQYLNYLRAPGYTGPVPTYIAATSKDGSFRNGMLPLKAPYKPKIDEWIREGKVPPEWAVPQTLAAYMAGKPVA